MKETNKPRTGESSAEGQDDYLETMALVESNKAAFEELFGFAATNKRRSLKNVPDGNNKTKDRLKGKDLCALHGIKDTTIQQDKINER